MIIKGVCKWLKNNNLLWSGWYGEMSIKLKIPFAAAEAAVSTEGIMFSSPLGTFQLKSTRLSVITLKELSRQIVKFPVLSWILWFPLETLLRANTCCLSKTKETKTNANKKFLRGSLSGCVLVVRRPDLHVGRVMGSNPGKVNDGDRKGTLIHSWPPTKSPGTKLHDPVQGIIIMTIKIIIYRV